MIFTLGLVCHTELDYKLNQGDYNVSLQTGVLYVVATPIGNLGDITLRAIETLRQVDLIAAEDTRHSRKLLEHFAISTPLTPLHEHNESRQMDSILEMLAQGQQVAIISDAGTPLISDPGFIVVRAAHQQGFRVVPIPGPSAMIAAISAAGLPTHRFTFEGFLPAKAAARMAVLRALQKEPRTLVFYEAPHRLRESLEDCCSVFGDDRPAVLARELTKTYETLRRLPLRALYDFVVADPEQQQGEAVLIVQGATHAPSASYEISLDLLLTHLLAHMSVKSAAQLAASLTGVGKNTLYDRALQLSQPGP
ncbi:MAG: 16S rRNA (cytidine(1402)-2'-O)-methyltransferase [Gammaproteobacteria bacterium]|nr:16S rRNA (cytidine(1402)-2'-O)-methyltransferase [Gammaproteobacteria bacterium]